MYDLNTVTQCGIFFLKKQYNVKHSVSMCANIPYFSSW